MNYEVDNTKHVKVMVFDAKDNSKETCDELNELFCHYCDKGWLLLGKIEYVPLMRFSMYWPELKPNSSISGKVSTY